MLRPSRTSPLWKTRPTHPRASAGAPASQENPCSLDCCRKACSSAPGAPSTFQGSPCQARRASPGTLCSRRRRGQIDTRAAARMTTSSRQQRLALQSGRARRGGVAPGDLRRNSHVHLRGSYLARWLTSIQDAAAPWCAAGRRPPHRTGAPRPARSNDRGLYRRLQHSSWACKLASAMTTALQGYPRRLASVSVACKHTAASKGRVEAAKTDERRPEH